MLGIPRAILIPLRNLLMECDQFGSDENLRSAFQDKDLIVFRSGLKSGTSIANRVDLNIPYLFNSKLRNGENALILFLHWLAQLYETDEKYEQFIRFANQLEDIGFVPISKNSIVVEANPDNAPMLPMIEIEQMYHSARSVAHVSVPRYTQGRDEGAFSGTAWMITPNLAISCAHVLRARNQYEFLDAEELTYQVNNSLLTFDYLSSGRGVQYRIAQIEYFEPDLDFIVMRLDERRNKPISDWDYLRIAESDVPLTIQSQLAIVQHPLGTGKQGAFGHYVENGATTGVVFYTTPTEPGASGAPVFNRQDWSVVALHQGENPVKNLRQGFLIKNLLSNLKFAKPQIYLEIQESQSRRSKDAIRL